ncbi:hypothetical protein EXIGLDRAFT_658249, partial [Exidia glandulosa HHB12029]
MTSAAICNALKDVKDESKLNGLRAPIDELKRVLEDTRSCVVRARAHPPGFISKCKQVLTGVGKYDAEVQQLGARLDSAAQRFDIAINMQEIELLATLADWSQKQQQRLDEINRNARLDRLRQLLQPLHDARFDAEAAPRPCVKDTCTDALQRIDTWISSDAPSGFWLIGPLGAGKSTIARSVSDALSEKKRLLASFFVSVSHAESSDPKRIVHSLAFQMAQILPREFHDTLHDALQNQPDIVSRPVREQIRHLLASPLQAIPLMAFLTSFVVVLDGLDQC